MSSDTSKAVRTEQTKIRLQKICLPEYYTIQRMIWTLLPPSG